MQLDNSSKNLANSSNKKNHLREVEVAIRSSFFVEDCVVVERQIEKLKHELVAYVVPSEIFVREQLLSHLQRIVPSEWLPQAIVPISTLPFNPSGEIDQTALSNLEIKDRDLVQRWSELIKSLPEVQQVAVVVQEHLKHLSDLLPNLTDRDKDDVIINDINLDNPNLLPDWFYRQTWRRKRSVTQLSAINGNFLVFLDKLGLGEYLGAELQKHGHMCVGIEAGVDFRQLGNNRYQIAPNNPEHYQRLLSVLTTNNFQIDKILHLWNYESCINEISSLDSLEEAQTQGVYSLLSLVKALANIQKFHHPIELLLVSTYTQFLSNHEDIAYEKFPLVGLLKVIDQEIPHLTTRHVDLTVDEPVVNAGRILQELHMPSGECQVAYRQGERWVPRLEKVDFDREQKQDFAFKAGGMYLISGGLGGVGVEIAKYLLKHYKARLLLVGRTDLPQRSTWQTYTGESVISQKIAAYQELEQLGGEIIYEAVDVCDLPGLQQVVEQASSRWGCELDGVLHLAGTYQERSLLEENHHTWSTAIRAKVGGAWILNQLLLDHPQAVFISFSSVSSFFGGASVGTFVAANQFLESFAHYQRSRGLKSYCFSWSLWDGIGISQDYQKSKLAQTKGYFAMSAPQGLSSLLIGLHHNQPQLLIGLDGSNRHIRGYVEDTYSLEKLTAYFTANSNSSVGEKLAELVVSDRFGTPSTCNFVQLQHMPLTQTGIIDFRLLTKGDRALTKYLKEQTESPAAIPDQKPAQVSSSPQGMANADIAVIGIGCRFPGANDYQQFWQNLEQGINSISEIPSERWEVEEYYSPNPQERKSISKWGGFIEKIDQFDAQFFGISAREAQRMDPQQRLMLELTWSCIEDAGYAPFQLSGGSVGVFIGVCNYDYDLLQNGYKQETDGHTGTGTWTCMIPNRISYFFNFHGPSIPVDTACSSSLVALHQAINALKSEECKTALVGGVSIFCTPTRYIQMSQLGMLSPQGQCKTFDSEADGYVRGEGAGVILLKPLAKAIEDQDQIYGVIKGSAVNHGGKARTLTSPNVYAQTKVLSTAYTKANIAPNTISYIEAHGTGTPLGDPIEINSLKRAFRQLHQQYHLSPVHRPYCGLGTVKTNIGHLEAAAGIAGVIKVLLAMKNQKLPKIVNFQQLNPRIDFQGTPFYLVCETQEWKQLKTEAGENIPRRAGISSFGVGGVNAHVILEEAPEPLLVNKELERPYHLLTLSAKNDQALAQLRHSYGEFLTDNGDVSLGDICSAANIGREHFNHRLAIVADSREKLVEQLASSAQNSSQIGKKLPKIAFLFTGQGSQYINMGKELYETQPKFRQTLEQCNEILRPYLEPSLLEVLYSEENSSLLNQTAYTQPALFAFEYALYQLWKSWGIEPEVVMGHSVGEYVAATVAGVLSLEDGLKLIAQRGQLMQQLRSGGEMVSLMASEEQVREVIAPFFNKVSIAAINSSQSIVISGASEDITTICQKLELQGVKTKRLQVSHAFHSPLMTPMLQEFAAVANQVTYNQPQIPIISNVTGQLADENIATADYWVNHVSQTVQFASSMEKLQSYEVFLEIGPKPTLLGMGRQCLPDSEGLWLPSLRPGVPEWEQLLSSLGKLYLAGVVINWSGFEGDYPHRKVALPNYPFQRQRYWIENTQSQLRVQKSPKLHPLLETKLQLPLSKEILFESQFSTANLPFLAEYQAYSQIVVPGACHLSSLLSAAKLTFGNEGCVLENIVFPQALAIPEGKARTVQLVLSPQESGKSFQLISFDPATSSNEISQWLVHATGKISPSINTTSQTIAIQQIQARCTQQIAALEIYQSWQKRQIELGASFQWLDSVWCGEKEALAKIKWVDVGNEQQEYELYPGLIDSCLQLTSIFFPGEDTFMPSAIESFRFYQRPQPQQLWCHAVRRQQHNSDIDKLIVDIKLFDFKEQLIAEIVGMEAKKVTRQLLLPSHNLDVTDWLYEIGWQAVDKDQSIVTKVGSWLIFTDPQGLGEQLGEQLQNLGSDYSLVSAGINYQKIDQQHYQIDPNQPEHYQKLLYDIGSQQQPLGIIYLWSIAPDETDESNLPAAELKNCGSVLHLVQALTQLPWQIQPHLWLVTQGTQAVTAISEPLQLSGSSLWGLGRVIALEYPEFQCVRLDLCVQGTRQQHLKALLLELSATDAEDQIAIRQGKRYVARLVRHTASCSLGEPPMKARVNQGQLSVQPDVSYLITGGNGALGLEVAGWLVEKGARHLVLTGRSEVSFATKERISDFEQLGVRVLVVKADVSEVAQVVEVLEKINSQLPPLRGIIHAAGILDGGVLKQQSLERFRRVMAPKVAGAWNLHTLTQLMPLDFFICFSSMSSLFGFVGQSNYAAANAFMDSLAHYRQTLGLPGLSINWGAWSQVGMAARMAARLDSGDQNLIQGVGIGTIAPLKGLAVLEQLLNQSSAQVAAIPINWSQLISKSATAPAFFANFTHNLTKRVEQSEFRTQLATAKISDRKKLLIDHLCSQVAQVLGHKLSNQDLQQGFFELGIDSLTAVELRNRLQNSLDYPLPSSLTFDYPTVTVLADYLGKEILSIEPSTIEPQASNRSHLSTALDELSESEIEKLLAQELAIIQEGKGQ
ncbi:Polyketide synthase [Desmonostoc muscorum LEGE 12446]|uniref:SDR family NAD(P)-dependent oxidoreductase n=1 Tax=Desmonostoc muscorum LEGE 12446 TaxID=1828758 RepID=A0A8J7A050_DESMC|nr:type I polyketide synthase [Desmonostoc muscorum]MCF2150414.1 Polyketide synthase [Desmonostoc muscorum LEGE 12446]